MKLSALISEYRSRMQISQREFSRRCGLSNTYISFIENETNPRTGRPIVPTLEQYQKIASAMDMTVHHLFELLDEDAPVDLGPASVMRSPVSIFGDLTPAEREILTAFRAADDRARADALSTLLQHPAAKNKKEDLP